MFERKVLTLGKSKPKAETTPSAPMAPPSGNTKKAKPATAPTAPKATAKSEAPETKAARVTLYQHLANRFPVWRDFKPLAIGAHRGMIGQLKAEGHPVTWALMKWVFAQHTRRKAYLQALATGGARYRLDGTVEVQTKEATP
jgi:hypothetical protein